MHAYLEVVREIRNTRGEFNVEPGKRIQAIASETRSTADLAAARPYSQTALQRGIADAAAG